MMIKLPELTLPQMLRGLGMILTFIPMTNLALGTLPPEEVKNASGLFMLIGQQPGESGAMAVAASVIAMSWNVTFNHWFERWELRQTVKGRSLKRRIAHALGFEGGLGAILIPVMAWWFGISLWEATVMEAGMLAFFLVYTYGFNWAFDRIFGLPAAAQG